MSKQLSEQQKRVCRGLATGRSLGEVAEEMDIVKETARCHLGAAYSRLGLTGDPDARELLIHMVNSTPSMFAARTSWRDRVTG